MELKSHTTLQNEHDSKLRTKIIQMLLRQQGTQSPIQYLNSRAVSFPTYLIISSPSPIIYRIMQTLLLGHDHWPSTLLSHTTVFLIIKDDWTVVLQWTFCPWQYILKQGMKKKQISAVKATNNILSFIWYETRKINSHQSCFTMQQLPLIAKDTWSHSREWPCTASTSYRNIRWLVSDIKLGLYGHSALDSKF
jgi:hypothetical protein